MEGVVKMDMRYLRYVKPGEKYYVLPTEKAEASELKVTNKPEGWQSSADSHWTYLVKPGTELPIQGWKIHISANTPDAQKTLDIASEFLFEQAIPFKYVSNIYELLYKNSKYGDRGSSGKFMTIYPKNEEQFVFIAETLDYRLKTVSKGPYILNDKRWYDGNIYFRYGAFGEMYIQEGGAKIPAIKTPEGKLIPDFREPYYHLPSFVVEPDAVKKMDALQEEAIPEPNELDNYEIESALHFSNGGGVYLAQNQAGEKVVIKEARPGAGLDGQGKDALTRLKHEAKILARLKGLTYVVEYHQSFSAWEHSFLVEEYIEGTPLNTWLAAYYPFSPHQSTADYCDKVLPVIRQLKEAVKEIHSKGIGMGDLQPANVLVAESGTIKLIDFEAASELDDDLHSGLMTPGYTGAFDLSREQSDWFALSRIARQIFIPIGPVQDLAEDILKQHDQWILQTYGKEALGLITEIDSHCKSISAKPVKSVLEAPSQYFEKVDIPHILKNLRSGLVHHLDTENLRLAAGDIRQYETEDGLFNISTGGFGIILALSRTGEVSEATMNWAQKYSDETYLKSLDYGLFSGKTGIAGVLYELGMIERAKEIYEEIPLKFDTEDISISTGLAGVGMGLLGISTINGFEHLQVKVESIAFQIEELLDKDVTLRARDVDGIAMGLLDGWSGVSLFYSALYRVTADPKWLDLSEKALNKDIVNCVLEESGLYQTKDAARYVPYLAGGSAGVSLAMLELRDLSNNPKKWQVELHGVGMVANSKCFYSPGLFRGLSGLITVADALSNELIESNEIVSKTIETLNLYLLKEKDSLYLPGDYCYRLSSDLFSGSSGLILVLNDIQEKRKLSWLPVPNHHHLFSLKKEVSDKSIKLNV